MDTETVNNQTEKRGGNDSKPLVRLIEEADMPWNNIIPEDPVRESGYILSVAEPDFVCKVQVVVDSFGHCLMVPFGAEAFIERYGRRGVNILCKQVPLIGSIKLKGGVRLGLK